VSAGFSAVWKPQITTPDDITSERVWILRSGETVPQAVSKIKKICPNAIFDVALSSAKHIKRVPVLKGDNRIKMLVFQGKVGDFAQLEGVIDALRALRRRFARAFIFNLPPVTAMPANDIPKMNERLLQLLIAA